MRSTVLRMERTQMRERDQVIELLQQAYEQLVSAALEAGRAVGYLGSDPLGAITHLASPNVGEARLCQLGLELWRSFFTAFRADEAEFEARRFAQAAADVQAEVEALGEGGLPDAALAERLLATLTRFWDERQEALNQRLDMLITELKDHQRRLGSADLQTAYQSDEMGRAAELVRAALTDLGERSAADDSLPVLLAQLVRRWRAELLTRKGEVEAARSQAHDFLAALQAASLGKPGDTATLSRGSARVVAQVADLVAGCREQEQALRDLERERAEQASELERLRAELLSRDQQLTTYEFSEQAPDQDARLPLYRQAVAAWREQRDPEPFLAQVRELERVFVLPSREVEQAVVLLDRRLDALAGVLGDLRRVLPLGEDPRRFRPRLLGAVPYRLKTLPGQIQALRDAGRDLCAFIDRTRWAAGVQVLRGEHRRLRKVFTEMVRLVGELRERLGGPLPASCTMDIGSTGGLVSLPAVLAVDLKTLLRAKGAARHAGVVNDLLQECCAMLRQVAGKALGRELPVPEEPKREGPTKAIARRADELVELAGQLDATFAEARARDWQLSPAEQRLLVSEQLLLQGLADLDGACDVIGVLDGAPPSDFPRIAKGRQVQVVGLLQAACARIDWLQEVARYRLETAS